ncbi:sensor histidine kinase [Paraburkholderia azotifigens]|uniref:sensor histidine kinase n=1 Tax=Paraburkholderia azotifigens TaxID=2057004 RepID=UPI003178FC53
MNLSEFIEADQKGLVDDWANYALLISPDDSHLSETQLRDSAAEILAAISHDMRIPQSASQQRSKSRGDERDPESQFIQVARSHADDRLEHGFGINDVVAEFRALRATVLRRWLKQSSPHANAFQEMIRFNEAIDEVLAESVRRYAERTTHIRDLFSGVLAHDLRSPLGAILNSAELLLHEEHVSPAGVRAVAFVQRGARRMKQMIDDLLVFTRTRLGDALPVSFTPQDIGRICREAVDEVEASHPLTPVDLRLSGNLRGRWDGARLGQLLVNLLGNAARYGSGHIVVEATDQGEFITIAVSNEGNPIPQNALPTLFDPLTRAGIPNRNGYAAGMGLGLYICKCIAVAHQGSIGVESTDHGTCFTVRIPHWPSPPG